MELVKSQCVVKYIQDFYRVVATGTRFGGWYKLGVTMNSHLTLTATTMSIEELRRRRYGHLNHNDYLLLQRKKVVEGISILKNDHVKCEACALGKQHREEFSIHKKKNKQKYLN